MSEHIHISDIAFNPDYDSIFKKVRVRPGSSDALELREMLEAALKIARPAAFYRSAQVEKGGSETVTIAGVQFESRVLRINLEKAKTVFPFVASCGMELQEWGEQESDVLRSYWAEAIKEEALLASISALQKELKRREKIGHFSTMSPGSLESWPISQQAPLFELLKEPSMPPLVKLTDSMLMIPTKSVSGIIFETDASFESCMLCQRDNCPNRRAPYDETLFEREYCPATL